MREFSHPITQLQNELEEIQDEISRRQKSIREIKNQRKELAKKQELLEVELEEFFAEETRVQREINKAEIKEQMEID